MKFFSHLNSAGTILDLYKGEQPFGIFLKQFFSQHKKYGSKDRKQIGHLCYCYFRLGKALLSLSMEDRILTGLFLCSDQPNELLQAVKPQWDNAVSLSLEKKCAVLSIEQTELNVFPWLDKINEDIDAAKFNTSFFIQPDLFIRIRPGNEETVPAKLKQGGLFFQQLTPSCIALPNSSKIETVVELNKEAVIQDRSSQEIGNFLQHLKPGAQNLTLKVWDCCAASGGKSIMAKDVLGKIDLTVSDIRESILVNLKKRFREAGITNYKSKIENLNISHSPLTIHHSPFDLIIADVPCTGSGTWGRTPEQLFYFEEKKIAEYAAKQKAIVSNTIPALKPGGYFLYITCSVFKKENEEVIQFIRDNYSLQLIKSELIKGYDRKADTLFAALLQQPL